MSTVTTILTILDGFYDGDNRLGAGWNPAQTDLEFFLDGGDNSYTALAFYSDIPPDTVITSATLRVVPTVNTSAPTAGLVVGITDSHIASGSEVITEVIPIDEQTFTTAWTSDVASDMVLTTDIQEVLDHASYSEGKSIYIKLSAAFSDATSYKFYSYEGDPDKAAKLIVVYDTPDAITPTSTTLSISRVLTSTGSNTREDLNKFQPNETYLTLSDITGSYVDWEIRLKSESTASMKFRTTSTGLSNPAIANITAYSISRVGVNLDRTKDYYVRAKQEGNDWSAWQLLELTPEKRTILGKHRDTTTVTNSSRGATVRTNNPLWEEVRTSKGIKIVNKLYTRNRGS